MAKFVDYPEAERISFLKEEFIRTVQELLIDPTKVQKNLSEDKFKTVMEAVPSIKVPGCNCGECLAMEKFEGRIPNEFQCLIEVARKRCEEKTYPELPKAK